MDSPTPNTSQHPYLTAAQFSELVKNWQATDWEQFITPKARTMMDALRPHFPEDGTPDFFAGIITGLIIQNCIEEEYKTLELEIEPDKMYEFLCSLTVLSYVEIQHRAVFDWKDEVIIDE